MVKIHRMKDSTDKFTTDKGPFVPSLPARLILVSKSGGGKTSVLGNLLLKKEFYRDDFPPENIFIFTGSMGDPKINTIASQLDIPTENIIDGYDETQAGVFYDMMVDEYKQAISEGKPPKNSLFLFDDLSYTNLLRIIKKNSIIDKIYANGRKWLISVVTTTQKFSSINTSCRENVTCALLWGCSNKQLELIENDFNYLNNKKQFLKLFRDNTKEKHDFLVVDFSKKDIYRNMEFKKLCMCKGKTECDGVK
tara:strand:- start:5468 stop:6220 length:753 start_codon:yes stop_codon:yes gene_type:complete